jgi:hypothetical protein
MKKSRVLLAASGLTMAVAGLAGSFLPHEILLYAGVEATGVLPAIVQLHAAILVGFGAMNWMSKDSLIGGIYGRPLVIGNLLHFVMGALALHKNLSSGMNPVFIVLTAIYARFAIGFGAMLFTSPVKANA